MLKGVSINFGRSVDSVSRESEGAERTNLCTGPYDEYGGEEASRIRITVCREGGNKLLTNTIQSTTSSSSRERKKNDLCINDDIEGKKEDFAT